MPPKLMRVFLAVEPLAVEPLSKNAHHRNFVDLNQTFVIYVKK